MRPASDELPTMNEAGELPAGPLAGTQPDGEFDPVAVLKVLRGNFDGPGASPARAPAPPGPAGQAHPEPGRCAARPAASCPARAGAAGS